MDIGIISMRYAKALLQFALEENKAREVSQEMGQLLHSYQELPALKETLENPVLEKEKKRALLIQAAGAQVSTCTARFIDLVLAHERASWMPFMAHAYITLYNKHQHVTPGCLTVAAPVDDSTVSRMKELVEKRAQGQIDLTVKVDPAIGGGYILEYDTYRLDASLSELLSQFRRGLLEPTNR